MPASPVPGMMKGEPRLLAAPCPRPRPLPAALAVQLRVDNRRVGHPGLEGRAVRDVTRQQIAQELQAGPLCLLVGIHVTLKAETGRGKSLPGAAWPRGRAVSDAASAESSATPRRETGEASRPPWPDACLYACHPRPVNGYTTPKPSE